MVLVVGYTVAVGGRGPACPECLYGRPDFDLVADRRHRGQVEALQDRVSCSATTRNRSRKWRHPLTCRPTPCGTAECPPSHRPSPYFDYGALIPVTEGVARSQPRDGLGTAGNEQQPLAGGLDVELEAASSSFHCRSFPSSPSPSRLVPR